MQKLMGFRNASLIALAIAGFQFSGTAAVADTQTIDQSGYWEAVTDTAPNGDAICGVRTHMRNGGELRLMVLDGGVHLVAHDPNWSMRADARPRVYVNVDGDVFRGNAVAADRTTLVVPGLTMSFLEQFIDGYSMDADLGGVRWTVNLRGSSRATSAMVECVTSADGGARS